MSLVRRVPKRGFTNIFRKEYALVNLDKLADLEGEVTPAVLVDKGIVRKGMQVKVLGDGEVGKALKVSAHKFSKSAQAKIEAAGGQCEVLAL
jgi:large subunit ribosomal protein L15